MIGKVTMLAIEPSGPRTPWQEIAWASHNPTPGR
jgi:hypothetical protein